MLRLALKVSAIALAAIIVIGLAIIVTDWWIDLRPAFAFDNNGQWNGIDAKTRQWFKSVRNQHGIPCCDIADGHPTDYDIRDDGYWIPMPDEPQTWIPVPPEAVVEGAGNPTGEAVVWYTKPGGVLYIRCFVPASLG